MPTIHEQIDEMVAAAVHNQLSRQEQHALHVHLVECADCRQLHKQEQLMNKMFEETFADDKPDRAFEQRMLVAFRRKAPYGASLGAFLVNAFRLRAVQLTAAAALLLALVQMGRLLTRDDTVIPLLRQARVASATPASAGYLGAATAPVNAPRQKVDVHQAVPAQASSVASETQAGDAETKREASDEVLAKEKDASVDFVMAAPAAPNQSAPPQPSPPPNAGAINSRKLVKNARVELEIASFNEAVQKITGLATEARGYVATSSSQKQENGKLRGEVIVKILPETLDQFLSKLREVGELKNQTLGTEDVTKQYFDTDSRLQNARALEHRLLEILKKKSDDINDLLQVEKELGRVREQVEQLQGELKVVDMQVQFATVTIALAEKDMNIPAAFLLKERAQLALFSPEVEKVYTEIKALASAKIQVTHAQLDRDNSGRVSARVSMLIAPEESDGVIANIKARGRVDNFQVQTERVARGGQGMSEEAKTERDKVELNITITREEEEVALQQTSLNIRATDVNEQTKQLRDLAEKQGGRVRSSSFARDPNGHEYANVALRVPMKNYNALMQLLGALGKVEDVSVHRQERPEGKVDEANAPADLAIQVYSQGNIVSEESGLIATIRRTLGQGAAALMWSVRMMGVAIAFLAPWILALAVIILLVRGIKRMRVQR